MSLCGIISGFGPETCALRETWPEMLAGSLYDLYSLNTNSILFILVFF